MNGFSINAGNLVYSAHGKSTPCLGRVELVRTIEDNSYWLVVTLRDQYREKMVNLEVRSARLLHHVCPDHIAIETR